MASLTIAVASGKGGTGKTTIAANLALSIANAHYIDCDAEAPNGHLFLRPALSGGAPVSLSVPRIDPDQCTLCGDCAEACEFNALAVTKKRVMVFDSLCHGCGVCAYVCPVAGALHETKRPIGQISWGTVADGVAGPLAFTQGALNVGESSAVPVIKAAKAHGAAVEGEVRILDAPPGTACPMVETLHGADFCLLVTEPTPFGLHDLELAVGVTRVLGVPTGLVLNRCDIGDDAVLDYCAHEAIPVLMRLPFNRALAEAYSRGIPWVSAEPDARAQFRALWDAIRVRLTP